MVILNNKEEIRMALGYLFLWFVIMGVLAIVGTALLFLIKNNKVVDVLLVLMTTYSMSIAFLNAMAQPSNFLGSQILAWLIKQPQPTFAVSKPDSSNYDPSN